MSVSVSEIGELSKNCALEVFFGLVETKAQQPCNNTRMKIKMNAGKKPLNPAFKQFQYLPALATAKPAHFAGVAAAGMANFGQLSAEQVAGLAAIPAQINSSSVMRSLCASSW
jgi:hypothetical protein